jgi:hypothetical protein
LHTTNLYPTPIHLSVLAPWHNWTNLPDKVLVCQITLNNNACLGQWPWGKYPRASFYRYHANAARYCV